MRHKMVTLCPTTYEIAQKTKNFSGWIREQLHHKNNNLTIDELLEETDRQQQLLSQIAMGEKKWQQGIGWVDVE